MDAPPENFQHQDPQIDLKNGFYATKFLRCCSLYGKFLDFQRSTFGGFPGQWTPCPIISVWLITTKGCRSISFPESSLKLLAGLFVRYRLHLKTLKLQFLLLVVAVISNSFACPCRAYTVKT